MVTTRLETLRPCGRLETYSTARHHLGFYNNKLVFAALRHVIAEQPYLSAVPVNEDKSYPEVYFARLPEIDLRTCVEFQEQHGRNFRGSSGSTPYWRLIITGSPKTPEIFIASWLFHHALSDGASAILFHRCFLEGLNTASFQKDVDPVVEAPSTKLLPPLEEQHSMTISWSFFLRAIAGSVLPSYFAQRPPNLWTGCPVDAIIQPPAPPHNRTMCHNKGTSVTAALSSLLSDIIFSLTKPQNEIKVDIPISLRPSLSIPENQITNAITNASLKFDARLAKEQLADEVRKRGTDNPIALLKYMGKSRDSSIEISNLGVYRPRPSIATQDPVETHQTTGKIGLMTFSQSPNMTGAQICISVVTGGDGCMVINFGWPEEALRYEVDSGGNMLHDIPRLVKDHVIRLAEDDEEEISN
ncbi:hypothetical protein EJ07DRAFT_168308 [Lizonia empirigonia]|nr:hypothetical protein EJ07DRAFT_168308 [Lizonia empirigonia]